MKPFSFLWRKQDVLHDGLPDRSAVALEDFLKQLFGLLNHSLEQVIRNEGQRMLHPLAVVLGDLLIANEVIRVHIATEPPDALQGSGDKGLGPNTLERETVLDFGRMMIIVSDQCLLHLELLFRLS